MVISKARIDGRRSPADHAHVPSTRRQRSNELPSGGAFGLSPQPSSFTRLLRIRQVMEVTGLSRMTIYRLEQAGKFPRRRQLGANSVAWSEADISQWADSRPLVPLSAAATNPREQREA